MSAADIVIPHGDVIIYGASDDLIEVEGAITEEFHNVVFSAGAYVYASTGDTVRFVLNDEGWRATVIHGARAPLVDHLDGEDDRVVLAGPVAWIVATTTEPARAR